MLYFRHKLGLITLWTASWCMHCRPNICSALPCPLSPVQSHPWPIFEWLIALLRWLGGTDRDQSWGASHYLFDHGQEQQQQQHQQPPYPEFDGLCKFIDPVIIARLSRAYGKTAFQLCARPYFRLLRECPDCSAHRKYVIKINPKYHQVIPRTFHLSFRVWRSVQGSLCLDIGIHAIWRWWWWWGGASIIQAPV